MPAQNETENMSRLDDATARLHARLRAVRGTAVTYRRGLASVQLTATVGATPTERDDGAGTIVRSTVRDYLIAVSELVLGGEAVTPQRGDRIEEASGHVYEVMPVGKEAAWRYSTPGRDTYRVHTRLIENP